MGPLDHPYHRQLICPPPATPFPRGSPPQHEALLLPPLAAAAAVAASAAGVRRLRQWWRRQEQQPSEKTSAAAVSVVSAAATTSRVWLWTSLTPQLHHLTGQKDYHFAWVSRILWPPSAGTPARKAARLACAFASPRCPAAPWWLRRIGADDHPIPDGATHVCRYRTVLE